MITPIALAPAHSATERKSTSTDGLCRLTGGPSATLTRYWAPSRYAVICCPPGAIKTRPGSTRSPSDASTTSTSHRPSSRAANAAVNFSGMCCTTTIPGDTRGSEVSTTSSAWVPPVEVPIATSRSVVTESLAEAGTGDPATLAAAARRWAGIVPDFRTDVTAFICRMSPPAAPLTMRAMSATSDSRKALSPSLGLVMIATAPALIA